MWLSYCYSIFMQQLITYHGPCGRDRMVVGFITSVYYH
jgi:hypothetical protein